MGEFMSQVQERPRLEIAEGAIDPDVRVANGEITNDEIEEFASRLETEEFYDEIKKLEDDVFVFIPNVCVDGRIHGKLGPNSAGGTNTLVVADALTTNAYRKDGEKAPAHALTLFNELKKAGYEIGGHGDDRATDEKCGCGAQDREDEVLAYIARRGEDVRTVIADLGIEIDDTTHNMITHNAVKLGEENYTTNGKELREAYVDIAGEESVPDLPGNHNEVAVVINTQAGTTLNREKIAAAYGNDKLQAFNVDVPALQKAAEAISHSPEEVTQKFIAMLYYNVATAAVLAGPSLRVIIR